jgi:hypothetical protein
LYVAPIGPDAGSWVVAIDGVQTHDWPPEDPVEPTDHAWSASLLEPPLPQQDPPSEPSELEVFTLELLLPQHELPPEPPSELFTLELPPLPQHDPEPPSWALLTPARASLQPSDDPAARAIEAVAERPAAAPSAKTANTHRPAMPHVRAYLRERGQGRRQNRSLFIAYMHLHW